MRFFTPSFGKVYIYEQDGVLLGYAFVWHTDGKLWAQEFVAVPQVQAPFAAALMARYGRDSCDVTGLQFSDRRPLGCVLRHDGAQPIDGYINLMLN